MVDAPFIPAEPIDRKVARPTSLRWHNVWIEWHGQQKLYVTFQAARRRLAPAIDARGKSTSLDNGNAPLLSMERIISNAPVRQDAVST